MTAPLLVDVTGAPTSSEQAREQQVPVFKESIGGALIDSARITVMAAIAMLPDYTPLAESPLEDAPPSLHEHLDQAMQWLDNARAITVQMGAPVTSLHQIERPRG